MKIVTLYQPQYTDGYKHYPLNIYFESETDSDTYSKDNHQSYAVDSKSLKAIVAGDGEYYILSSDQPVHLYDSGLEKEKIIQQALDKLTKEERELLGF